jgi:hypothetical protein
MKKLIDLNFTLKNSKGENYIEEGQSFIASELVVGRLNTASINPSTGKAYSTMEYIKFASIANDLESKGKDE